MAEYQRYRPRRSSSRSGGWGRWLVVGGVVIALIVISKLAFGGKKTSTSPANTNANQNAGIALLTDNRNVAVTNSAPVLSINATTSTNTASAGSGTWNGFSVKSCPNAISNFGTTKRVALTIGFSAANDAVTKVLDSLKQAAVPADFFVSGSFATKNPATVKSASQAGYTVYSQSYDSSDLTKLSDADVTSAVIKTETAIVAATGATSKPIFRPPAGSYTTNTLKLLHQQGYCAVLWTVDAYDWQDGMTAALAKDRVMTAVAKQHGGSIVALHAGYDITPQLITDVVTDLKTQGYEIVSLATLLNS